MDLIAGPPPCLPNLVEKSDQRTHYKFSRCPNWGQTLHSLQPLSFYTLRWQHSPHQVAQCFAIFGQTNNSPVFTTVDTDGRTADSTDWNIRITPTRFSSIWIGLGKADHQLYYFMSWSGFIKYQTGSGGIDICSTVGKHQLTWMAAGRQGGQGVDTKKQVEQMGDDGGAALSWLPLSWT